MKNTKNFSAASKRKIQIRPTKINIPKSDKTN